VPLDPRLHPLEHLEDDGGEDPCASQGQSEDHGISGAIWQLWAKDKLQQEAKTSYEAKGRGNAEPAQGPERKHLQD
jgi:hypothetical protein